MRVVTSFSGLSGRPYAVAPEWALLYLTSNAHAVHEGNSRLRALLDSSPRWDQVLELSYAHGVTGLVRYCLRRSGYWSQVPETARFALDSWHRTARARHLLLVQQLGRVLSAAAVSGIEPTVLKGAALAATAYPDPALRPMVDIDLLIDPADLPGMTLILEDLGYHRHASDAADSAFNRVNGYHHLFYDPIGARFPIEVHWRPASMLEQRNTLSTKGLQEHTTEVRVAVLPGQEGRRARVLTPEAHIVYLATHAAQERHVFSELKLLADIASVAVAPCPLDWPALVRLAGQVRARRATYVALALSHDLLGVDVPHAVLAELRPPRLIGWALERTLNPATLLKPIDEHRQAIVKYLVVDSAAITARLVREKIAPSPATLRARDPRARGESLVAAYGRHVVTIGAGAVRKAGFWLLARRAAPGIRRVAVFTRDARGRIADVSFRAEQQ